MNVAHTLLLPLLLLASPVVSAADAEPVIDMHAHAFALEVPPGTGACTGDQGMPAPTLDPRDEFSPELLGGCEHSMPAPADDAALMHESLAAFRRHNVRRAVIEGSVENVAAWRAQAPGLYLPGVGFGKRQDLTIEELRALHAAGQLAVLGEGYLQYRGHSPTDERYAPYFALAEELDIPVGLHLGEGPPAGARFPGYETYRVAMGSPLLLEPVLRKHPRMRLYVMHYGSPLVDEMIAMMFTYPQLYVDVSSNVAFLPRAQFHEHLKRLVDAGMGKRILFGSDLMYWPGAIRASIDSINQAPFLSQAQKRDILYNNAARFLRLTPEEIAADHAPLPDGE